MTFPAFFEEDFKMLTGRWNRLPRPPRAYRRLCKRRGLTEFEARGEWANHQAIVTVKEAEELAIIDYLFARCLGVVPA